MSSPVHACASCSSWHHDAESLPAEKERCYRGGLTARLSLQLLRCATQPTCAQTGSPGVATLPTPSNEPARVHTNTRLYAGTHIRRRAVPVEDDPKRDGDGSLQLQPRSCNFCMT